MYFNRFLNKRSKITSSFSINETSFDALEYILYAVINHTLTLQLQ
jgi:hypothetical protein